MSKIVELRNELAAKQDRLAIVFREAGAENDMSKVTSLTGTSEEKAAEIKRLNDEMSGIGKRLDTELDLEKTAKHVKKVGEYLNTPVDQPPHPSGGGQKAEERSLGQYVIESEEFKSLRGHSKKTFAIECDGIDFKTLFQTTAGFPPESTRTGRVVEAALLGPQVLDIIPSTPTTQASIVYMRETVTTEAAAERLEAGAYAEAQLSFAEDSSAVRSIGVSLPITDEQLEDVPGVQGLVDGRLILFLRRRLDRQVLVGDGAAPNLRGVNNVVGIQTQAKGADPVMDAIHKAITLVSVTGAADPSAIILHPNDWQGIRLAQTADGIYLLGNPADVGVRRLWGLPVVLSTQQTENTGLVGDFRGHCELRPRNTVEVQVGFVNDDFTKGKQTIRGGVRTAFVVYRVTAFCTVTGI